MKKQLFILGHVVFWCLGIYIISKIFGVSTVEVFADTNGSEEEVVVVYDNHFVWATLVTIFFSAIIFYANIFWLLPKYFESKNLRGYLIKLIIIITICFVLVVVFDRFIIYNTTTDDGLLAFPSLEVHAVLIAFFTTISFAYAFTQEWYKNEQLKSKIAQEKLKTELNFLKSQVNPHFLFNTLNNLFSIAQKYKVPELTSGISELSNLMRYMLYESNAAYVSLKKEVNHIESFIEVQRLRFDESDEVIINFEKKGKLETIRVAPLVLLPFVENAFKHGFSINQSSIINIVLDVTDGNIRFEVKNKLFDEPKLSDSASGIGLENVKRRLELIYPKMYELRVRKTDGYFKIVLKIKEND